MDHLFHYASSVYGGEKVILGASFDLLNWFVAAGLVICAVHALYKIFASKPNA